MEAREIKVYWYKDYSRPNINIAGGDPRKLKLEISPLQF